MEEIVSVARTHNAIGQVAGACSVCGRESGENRIPISELSEDLQRIISANAPAGSLLTSVCGRCVELFERARASMQANSVVFEQGGHVLSTPLRLGADDRFTGRGVTIAFLDSGYYAHADLTTPENRILAYHTIVRDDPSTLETPDSASWHGMMTSVVAAGNGSLSGGFYRGIAPDAKLVLVKISTSGRIPERNILKGLEWVMAHAEDYNIRVVNISAGGDDERSYLKSALARTVERAVKQGLTVVCAVGNAGHIPGHPVLPPASAPSCIAVGGLDDQNSLDRQRRGMYRSSYGPTVDGLQKPEVIAPGIWVPAPILPHTPTAEQAELYHALDNASDGQLHEILNQHPDTDPELHRAAHTLPISLLRQLISIKLREESVITEHYKYVDGTSFAAPIVTSVAACMLEANPALNPQQIKRILIDTAERLPHIEVERQGWGVINPRRAIEFALRLRPPIDSNGFGG